MAYRLAGLSRAVVSGRHACAFAPRHVRWGVVAAFSGAVVGLAILTRLGGVPAPNPSATTFSQPGEERIFTVVPVATASFVALAGTVAAGRSVAVVAPFDGVIRERRTQIGDPVRAGEVLAVLDDGEIQTRLREAEAAFLKSSMAVALLDRWADSPDVIRARRVLEAAEASLTVIERQVPEIKKLLDRGIVSRNEYDGLVQQRDMLRNSAAGASLDLHTTLERGNADNRRLAELELQNARARLDDLKAQAAGQAVRAPIDGILARPPVGRQGGLPAVEIESGAHVSRGQAMFAIADTTTLVVTGQVDEVDVNRIRIGQVAQISSDAFPGEPIQARLIGISAEADGEHGGGRSPSFQVRAAFSREATRDQIRLGMSALMRIQIASNPQALVVPIEAVRDAATNPTVQVRDRQSGQTRPQQVRLGSTQQNGIEILSGIQPGDEIAIQR